MKQMCRTGGSLGKIRNGTTDRKSSPAPKIDDSLCLLRSSSSWVQSAKSKKKEDETKERDRVSSEDTVLTEICQDDDTDLERLKNSTVNQSSSDAAISSSDTEYAASPAAASRMQTTPRFKDKKLSRIRRSTHRRRIYILLTLCFYFLETYFIRTQVHVRQKLVRTDPQPESSML